MRQVVSIQMDGRHIWVLNYTLYTNGADNEC